MAKITDNIKPLTPQKSTLCLCKALGPFFKITQLFGTSPIAWKNEGGFCIYQKSTFYLCYSLFLLILLIVNFSFYSDFSSFVDSKPLPILLSRITDAIYYLYLIMIITLCCFKATLWSKVLTNMARMSKFGLPCESALKTIKKLSMAFFSFYCFILISDGAIFTFLHFSTSYETKFHVPFVLGKMLQNAILMYYVYSLTNFSVIIAILTCFENLSVNSLRYSEIYPMKKITGSDNQQDIFIFFTYKVCKSEHVPSPELQKRSTAEIIEYFRIMHEEISEMMYSFNYAFNPLLLIHVVIEIIMLVISWYSVVIGIAYKFNSPEADTIFVLNLVFAVTHSVGLFVYLRNAQKITNLVQGYTSFLMEYSTRVSTAADHLQLRIFIEKIKQQKPLTANGIFTIDLGIAGPIFANILTYVLVALQFKIPQEDI